MARLFITTDRSLRSKPLALKEVKRAFFWVLSSSTSKIPRTPLKNSKGGFLSELAAYWHNDRNYGGRRSG